MSEKTLALQTLRESDVGRGLMAADLQRVMELTEFQYLEPGEELLRQMAPAEAVYLPCTGMLMVERSALTGSRQVIEFLTRGNYLGFTATDQYLYSASALESSIVLRFSRERFIALCNDIPPLKENLSYINNRVLAGLLDHLFAIGQKRAHERLAFFIQQLYQRQDRDSDHPLIPLPMSRTDIGDYLGLTLETTSRAFSRLRDEGLITTPDRHSVIIEDHEQLSTLAELE